MRTRSLLLALAAGARLPGCIDYEVSREREHQAWTQPSRDEGVDVLWVVDDSQSMYEEQLLLSEHAAAFVDFLSVVAVDWRLLVVTTDPEAGGIAREVLSAETEALAQAFAAEVLTGAEGSRDERGFEAVLGVLDSDALRPEAALEVVVFSDEDDHSDLAPADFVDALDGARDAAVLSAIVGDQPAGCASAVAAADPGDRYIEAQELSGGLRESICAADYDALLERVAFHVLGMNNSFALDKVPEVSTMEVRVDGALVHQRDRHGWRYEGGDNAVVFDGFAVPRPGAAVGVSYYEWAGGPTDTGG